MKIAVIGPICRDKINISGTQHFQPGGATYYNGLALSSLGIDVTVFGAYNTSEDDSWLASFKKKVKLIAIPTAETLTFLNEYPDPNSQDLRVQKVKNVNCVMDWNQLKKYDFQSYDGIALGPLFHNNFSLDFVKNLHKINPHSYLAGQGIIRYSDKGKVIWRNPEKLQDMLPYVKALFVDEQEFEFMSGNNESPKFRDLEKLIITNGSKGSTIITKGSEFEIPAFPPTETVDATGAGDTYMAGVLAASERFSDVYQIGIFAAMASTLCLEHHGALKQSFEEILKRIREIKIDN
jgi:hypothetical protein